MKLKNRYIHIASALAIAGLVASQIPSQPSISLAANGYDSGSSTNTAVLAVGGLGVLSSFAGGAAAGAGGGAGAGAGMIPGSGQKPITLLLSSIDSVSEFSGIVSNSGVDLNISVALGIAGVTTQPIGTKELKAEGYTILAPTNDSLIKALGAEKVALMKQPAGRALAKAFVSGLIVAGRFNVAGLKDVASLSKSLFSLGGDSISLKVDGGKLMANTAEVLATEYAASNGWILVTNGVVNSN
jgi:Fasciclin domain